MRDYSYNPGPGVPLGDSVPPSKVTGYEGPVSAKAAYAYGNKEQDSYDRADAAKQAEAMRQEQQKNADILVDLSVLSVFSDRKLLNNTVSTLRNEAMKLFLEADCYESLAEALEKFFD